ASRSSPPTPRFTAVTGPAEMKEAEPPPAPTTWAWVWVAVKAFITFACWRTSMREFCCWTTLTLVSTFTFTLVLLPGGGWWQPQSCGGGGGGGLQPQPAVPPARAAPGAIAIASQALAPATSAMKVVL